MPDGAGGAIDNSYYAVDILLRGQAGDEQAQATARYELSFHEHGLI